MAMHPFLATYRLQFLFATPQPLHPPQPQFAKQLCQVAELIQPNVGVDPYRQSLQAVKTSGFDMTALTAPYSSLCAERAIQGSNALMVGGIED